MCGLALWPQKHSQPSFYRYYSNHWSQLLYVLHKVPEIIIFFEETRQLLSWIYYFYVWPSHEQKGNDCDTMQKEKRLRRRRRTFTVIAAFWQWCIASVTVKWPPHTVRISKLPLKLSYLITLGVIIFEPNSVGGGFRRAARIHSDVEVSGFAARG